MRNFKSLSLVFSVLYALTFGAAHAALSPYEISENPAIESAAREIFSEVRCPVCTHQNLMDSEADLSLDLRNLIRGKLESGESQADVRQFLRATYGDDLFLKPPVEAATAPLWVLPFVFLAIGGIILIFKLKKSPSPKRFNKTSNKRSKS